MNGDWLGLALACGFSGFLVGVMLTGIIWLAVC